MFKFFNSLEKHFQYAPLVNILLFFDEIGYCSAHGEESVEDPCACVFEDRSVAQGCVNEGAMVPEVPISSW